MKYPQYIYELKLPQHSSKYTSIFISQKIGKIHDIYINILSPALYYYKIKYPNDLQIDNMIDYPLDLDYQIFRLSHSIDIDIIYNTCIEHDLEKAPPKFKQILQEKNKMNKKFNEKLNGNTIENNIDPNKVKHIMVIKIKLDIKNYKCICDLLYYYTYRFILYNCRDIYIYDVDLLPLIQCNCDVKNKIYIERG